MLSCVPAPFTARENLAENSNHKRGHFKGSQQAAYLNPAIAVVPWTTYLQQLEQQRLLLEELTAAPNAKPISVYGNLCYPEGCKGIIGGKLLYRNSDHLSEAPSLNMAPLFRDMPTDFFSIESAGKFKAEVK